jgi:hypothetical protein
MFPLCRTCAEQRDLGPDDHCQHTDSQHSLTETWVTSELQKALQLGYRLNQIYKVWHFPESSHNLFASYINTFLKIKHSPMTVRLPNNSNSTSKIFYCGKAF